MVTIALTSTDLAIAVPSSVTVPRNALQQTFPIRAMRVTVYSR